MESHLLKIMQAEGLPGPEEMIELLEEAKKINEGVFMRASDFPSADEIANELEQIAKDIWPNITTTEFSGRALMIKHNQMLEDAQKKYREKLSEYMKDKFIEFRQGDYVAITIDAKEHPGIVAQESPLLVFCNSLYIDKFDSIRKIDLLEFSKFHAVAELEKTFHDVHKTQKEKPYEMSFSWDDFHATVEPEPRETIEQCLMRHLSK